jgi:hypothetical protein
VSIFEQELVLKRKIPVLSESGQEERLKKIFDDPENPQALRVIATGTDVQRALFSGSLSYKQMFRLYLLLPPLSPIKKDVIEAIEKTAGAMPSEAVRRKATLRAIVDLMGHKKFCDLFYSSEVLEGITRLGRLKEKD